MRTIENGQYRDLSTEEENEINQRRADARQKRKEHLQFEAIPFYWDMMEALYEHFQNPLAIPNPFCTKFEEVTAEIERIENGNG